MKRLTKLIETRGERVDASDADVYVLGDGAVAAAVARRFHEADRSVALVDGSSEPADVPGRRADPTDASALAEVGLDDASTVIVATASDGRNLLAGQQIRSRFDVGRILIVANDPGCVAAFVDAGHEPICATTALADAIVDHA